MITKHLEYLMRLLLNKPDNNDKKLNILCLRDSCWKNTRVTKNNDTARLPNTAGFITPDGLFNSVIRS